MNIYHDVHLREDPGLYEAGNAVGDGAARIAGKGAVHVDAIERRDAGVGGAGALTQLRRQNHATGHLGRVEIMAQTLDRDLPFPFVPMSSSEDGHSRRMLGRFFQTVDHRERDQRISPTGVVMEGDVVVMLSRLLEIY